MLPVSDRHIHKSFDPGCEVVGTAVRTFNELDAAAIKAFAVGRPH